MTTLAKNLALAKDAIDYCRKFIKQSATAPDLSERKIILKLSREIFKERKKSTLEDLAFNILMFDKKVHWISYKGAVQMAKRTGLGNCGELSELVLNYLRKNNVESAEKFSIKNGDHIFIVIGRVGSDLKKPLTWGPDCVICDPLLGKVYPASEIYKHLQNYKFVPLSSSPNKFTKITKDDELESMSTLNSKVDLNQNQTKIHNFQDKLQKWFIICKIYISFEEQVKLSSFMQLLELDFPDPRNLDKLTENDVERQLEKIAKRLIRNLNYVTDNLNKRQILLTTLITSNLPRYQAKSIIYSRAVMLDESEFKYFSKYLRSYDENQNSLLNHACTVGRTDLMKLLIEDGFKLSATNIDGYTAQMQYQYSLQKKMLKIYFVTDEQEFIEELMRIKDFKIDLSAEEWLELLKTACSCGLQITVKYILSKMDLNVINSANGLSTPLHYALNAPGIEMIALLISHGLDIDKVDQYSKTALDLAIQRNLMEKIEYLTEQGATITMNGYEFAKKFPAVSDYITQNESPSYVYTIWQDMISYLNNSSLTVLESLSLSAMSKVLKELGLKNNIHVLKKYTSTIEDCLLSLTLGMISNPSNVSLGFIKSIMQLMTNPVLNNLSINPKLTAMTDLMLSGNFPLNINTDKFQVLIQNHILSKNTTTRNSLIDELHQSANNQQSLDQSDQGLYL